MYKPDKLRVTNEGLVGFCQEALRVRNFRNGSDKVAVEKFDFFSLGGTCRMGKDRELLGCTNHAFRDEVRRRLSNHQNIVDKIMHRFREPVSFCLGDYIGGEVMVGVCPFDVRKTVPPKDLVEIKPKPKRGRGRPRKVA